MSSPVPISSAGEGFFADTARLLPVRELRALLPALADLWRRNTSAVAAVLTTDSSAGFSPADGPPQFVHLDRIPQTGDDVRSAFSGSVPEEITHQRVDLPVPDSQHTLHLFLPPSAEALPIPEDWCELTAGLIRQAVLIDEWDARLQQDERQRMDEKLEALAEFAAGAGHEINNPLATIAGRARQLLQGETDPDRRRMLATIGGQALRVRDMIGDAMLFARPPRPELELVDLAEAIAGVVETLQPAAEERGCRLQFSCDSTIPVPADPTQLAVVIGALLRNSLEAVTDGEGEIAVECSPGERDDLAVFVVTDNGRGLSEKDRRHLFDPFYSGRQAGRGLGFGLCKCWRIVSNHGGRIDVESRPGRTAFRVFWPMAEG